MHSSEANLYFRQLDRDGSIYLYFSLISLYTLKYSAGKYPVHLYRDWEDGVDS